MKLEKQFEEPCEEPVPVSQTITVTEDKPREDTGADTAVETNALPVPTNDWRDIWEEEIQVANQTNPKRMQTIYMQQQQYGHQPQ